MSTRRNFQNRNQAQTTSSRSQSNQTDGLNDELINVTEVKETATEFIAKNQKMILSILTGLLLIVGGYLAYKFLYKMPRETEAVTAMYQAEKQFARDSFAAALNNPGGNAEGFADIAESFSGTNAGNTAKLYAGICNLNIGKFQEAIDFLESYSPNDEITPGVKYGSLGDAYSELGDFEKAMSNYGKAGDQDNEFSSPLYLNKLGLLQFSKKDMEGSLATFKKILDKYPTSQEARDAEKMVERLSK
jgi:tetratricopeptide (TPR) repeat protein